MHVKGNFDVVIYVDVNGQWVSGDRGSQVIWDLDHSEYTSSDLQHSQNSEAGEGMKTWKVKRETEQLLTEFNDRAEWGTLHFSAPSVCACRTSV